LACRRLCLRIPLHQTSELLQRNAKDLGRVGVGRWPKPKPRAIQKRQTGAGTGGFSTVERDALFVYNFIKRDGLHGRQRDRHAYGAGCRHPALKASFTQTRFHSKREKRSRNKQALPLTTRNPRALLSVRLFSKTKAYRTRTAYHSMSYAQACGDGAAACVRGGWWRMARPPSREVSTRRGGSGRGSGAGNTLERQPLQQVPGL